MTHDHVSMSDDEVLSAFLDGALTPDEATLLRGRLSREPQLAARLQDLEAANAKVRDAYAGIMDEPLPPHMLDLIERAAPAAAGASNVVPLRAQRRPHAFGWPASLAAGIALAVGIACGWVMGTRTAAPQGAQLVAATGVVDPDTPLHDVLQSTPSGESHDVGAQLAAMPRLSFRTHDGGHCRELRLTTSQGVTDALACRRADAWHIEVAAFSAADQGGQGVYRPAIGASTAVADTVDALIDGAPLERAQEDALIARGWTSERD